MFAARPSAPKSRAPKARGSVYAGPKNTGIKNTGPKNVGLKGTKPSKPSRSFGQSPSRPQGSTVTKPKPFFSPKRDVGFNGAYTGGEPVKRVGKREHRGRDFYMPEARQHQPAPPLKGSPGPAPMPNFNPLERKRLPSDAFKDVPMHPKGRELMDAIPASFGGGSANRHTNKNQFPST